MGRLVSGVWVSASFQMFTLTAGEMSWVGWEIVRQGECSGRNVSEGTCPTLVRLRYKYES